MIRLERSTGSKRLGWAPLVGVLLIPLMISGGFLAVTWDAPSRWGKVEAAIVNHDEPITIDGQIIPLGRQLAGGLVEPEDAPNSAAGTFDWVLSNPADAGDGLADGRYAAVITIGEDFSANATSYSANKGDEAEHATIDVQTSKMSGVTDGAVADAIAAAAVTALNDELSQQYLQNLYLGFNRTQRGMQRSADSADTLAAGASKLSQGIGTSASAGEKLAAGAGQLSDGADDVAAGADRTEVDSGRLTRGARRVADGVHRTHDGAVRLDRGVAELDRQVPKQRKGAGTLAEGLHEYTEGVNAYVGTVEPIAERVSDYAGAVQGYLDDASRIAGDIDRNLDEITEFAGGVGDYIGDVDQYTNSVTRFVDSVEPAADRAADRATDRAEGECARRQLTEKQCELFTAGVQSGSADTATGVKQALTGADRGGGAPSGGQLLTSSTTMATAGDQLAKDGNQIGNMTRRLGIDADQLRAGARQGAQQQISELKTATTKIKNAADKLIRSGERLRSGGDRLTTGADRLHAGTKKMENGVSDLHDGTGKLTDGTRQLTGEIGRLRNGAADLTAGLGRLSDGADQLATGAEQAVTGVNRLNDGLSQLQTGGTKVATGADRLATGLHQGAEQVPTYSEDDRTRLAEVAGQPITSDWPDQQFTHPSTGALLMTLALWIGGLVAYLVIRPISATAFGSSKSSVRLAVESVLPGVVIGTIQAVALSSVLAMLLDLGIARSAALAGFGVLVAAIFAILNHGLAGWFGGSGRFISFTVAVLAAAGAVTQALPETLATIRPYLPTTPALDGIQMIVADGPSIAAQLGALLGWLVIGVVAVMIAVGRRRMV